MKIDIKESTHKENEYKLRKLYKDNDGDVFYFVQDRKYFDVNYLIVDGRLQRNVIKVSSAFQSIQEVINYGYPIPGTPVPAKKLTIEF